MVRNDKYGQLAEVLGFWLDFEAPILVDLPVKVNAREL